MGKAKDDGKGEAYVKMYVRIDPTLRLRFKSLAHLSGETMEGRLERLMRDDVKKNLAAVAAKN